VSKLDLKICSVGDKREYIKGTVDRTGMSLLDTLGLIKNSKLFIGNDSGLYHCANALSIPNLVIFTFTSTVKNYDKRFHKYSKIIRKDLTCSPCQGTIRFNSCEDHGCRDIDPDGVVNAVYNELV
jgi:ADP-heptose:LPS heptosyltransferase